MKFLAINVNQLPPTTVNPPELTERILFLLIDTASRGLGDVAEGSVNDARSAMFVIKYRRTTGVAG